MCSPGVTERDPLGHERFDLPRCKDLEERGDILPVV
jgi:hypothetical protein